jgi:hypothetical protein
VTTLQTGHFLQGVRVKKHKPIFANIQNIFLCRNYGLSSLDFCLKLVSSPVFENALFGQLSDCHFFVSKFYTKKNGLCSSFGVVTFV